VKKVGILETLRCGNDATVEGWSEWKRRIRKYYDGGALLEAFERNLGVLAITMSRAHLASTEQITRNTRGNGANFLLMSGVQGKMNILNHGFSFGGTEDEGLSLLFLQGNFRDSCNDQIDHRLNGFYSLQ
jgi:hypothetical protein